MSLTSKVASHSLRSPLQSCASTINIAAGTSFLNLGRNTKTPDHDVPRNPGSPEQLLYSAKEPLVVFTPQGFASDVVPKNQITRGPVVNSRSRPEGSLDFRPPSLKHAAPGTPLPVQGASLALLSPVTVDIIAKLDEVARNIPSFPNLQNHGLRAPKPVPAVRLFSEFEISTNPSIFRYNHLIIRNDAIVGARHLHRGENGYLNLKSFSSVKTLYEVAHGYDSWKLWLSLQNYSIEEEWDNPLLAGPAFFDEHATLLFVERPGICNKGGDALYEFLGNFYVRRHRAIPDCYTAAGKRGATAQPPPGSFERALADLPYLSAALVVFQFIEEPDIKDYT